MCDLFGLNDFIQYFYYVFRHRMLVFLSNQIFFSIFIYIWMQRDETHCLVNIHLATFWENTQIWDHRNVFRFYQYVLVQ